MAKEKESICKKTPKEHVEHNGAAGAVYGLGLIGAAIYFIQNADTFGQGVIGLLKALVWPAFLIYEALKFLKL